MAYRQKTTPCRPNKPGWLTVCFSPKTTLAIRLGRSALGLLLVPLGPRRLRQECPTSGRSSDLHLLPHLPKNRTSQAKARNSHSTNVAATRAQLINFLLHIAEAWGHSFLDHYAISSLRLRLAGGESVSLRDSFNVFTRRTDHFRADADMDSTLNDPERDLLLRAIAVRA